MTRPIRQPRRALAAIALGALLVLAAGPGRAGAGTASTTVTVTREVSSPAIPAGFVSPSFELTALLTYAGKDPQAVDSVFEQLVRNLAPQHPVIRLGGDSTDWSWYPVAGMKRPPWVRYTLTPLWMQVARALAAGLGGKLILGVNLEADSSRIAGTEARAMTEQIGRSAIAGLELGNEPELYGSFNWYRNARHVGIRGRGPGYDVAAFSQEFGQIARALPAGVPVAGPSIGSPLWSQSLGGFLAANRRVSVATLHRYPLQRCEATTHVSAAQLLAADSSDGLAAGVAPYVSIARRFGAHLRIDEMNSVSCGGEPGVSNSFASALWALDAMFALARAGVSGVNIHTTPGAVNQLFSLAEAGTAWSARVAPIYYGLLAFAQAAPAGSQLLRVDGAPSGPLRMWADRSPGRSIHVVLIDTSPRTGGSITVRIPAGVGPAVLQQLRAPGLGATGGVTFSGQSFGSVTTTGKLTGPVSARLVEPARGAYRVEVPAASAEILTVGS